MNFCPTKEIMERLLIIFVCLLFSPYLNQLVCILLSINILRSDSWWGLHILLWPCCCVHSRWWVSLEHRRGDHRWWSIWGKRGLFPHTKQRSAKSYLQSTTDIHCNHWQWRWGGMLSAEGFSTNEVDFSSLEFPKYAHIFNLSRIDIKVLEYIWLQSPSWRASKWSELIIHVCWP